MMWVFVVAVLLVLLIVAYISFTDAMVRDSHPDGHIPLESEDRSRGRK